MNRLLSLALVILSAHGGPSKREDGKTDLGGNRLFSVQSLKNAWGSIFKASVFGTHLICYVCTLGLVPMACYWGSK